MNLSPKVAFRTSYTRRKELGRGSGVGSSKYGEVPAVTFLRNLGSQPSVSAIHCDRHTERDSNTFFSSHSLLLVYHSFYIVDVARYIITFVTIPTAIL